MTHDPGVLCATDQAPDVIVPSLDPPPMSGGISIDPRECEAEAFRNIPVTPDNLHQFTNPRGPDQRPSTVPSRYSSSWQPRGGPRSRSRSRSVAPGGSKDAPPRDKWTTKQWILCICRYGIWVFCGTILALLGASSFKQWYKVSQELTALFLTVGISGALSLTVWIPDDRHRALIYLRAYVALLCSVGNFIVSIVLMAGVILHKKPRGPFLASLPATNPALQQRAFAAVVLAIIYSMLWAPFVIDNRRQYKDTPTTFQRRRARLDQEKEDRLAGCQRVELGRAEEQQYLAVQAAAAERDAEARRERKARFGEEKRLNDEAVQAMKKKMFKEEQERKRRKAANEPPPPPPPPRQPAIRFPPEGLAVADRIPESRALIKRQIAQSRRDQRLDTRILNGGKMPRCVMYSEMDQRIASRDAQGRAAKMHEAAVRARTPIADDNWFARCLEKDEEERQERIDAAERAAYKSPAQRKAEWIAQERIKKFGKLTGFCFDKIADRENQRLAAAAAARDKARLEQEEEEDSSSGEDGADRSTPGVLPHDPQGHYHGVGNEAGPSGHNVLRRSRSRSRSRSQSHKASSGSSSNSDTGTVIFRPQIESQSRGSRSSRSHSGLGGTFFPGVDDVTHESANENTRRGRSSTHSQAQSFYSCAEEQPTKRPGRCRSSGFNSSGSFRTAKSRQSGSSGYM